MDATTTNNLPFATIVDEVLGNAGGNTALIKIERLVALIAALLGPTYATRAELYADLGWPAGSVGYVRADSDSARNGVYKKAGGSGTGSWSRIGDLPSGAIEAAELAALAADLRTRRIASTANANFSGITFPGGTTTVIFRSTTNFAIWQALDAAPAPATSIHQQDATGAWWERLFQLTDLRNALRNAGVFSLVSVGGTPNAITASFSDAALALGVTVDAATIVEVIAFAANTGAATLQIAGDSARTMQTEGGQALPANFMRPGVSMLFRRSGANWRALSSTTSIVVAELLEAIRSGSLIPLASIGGTGDAWTAQLAPAVITAGITSLNSDATAEYIPALPNAAANPTGTIAGTTFNIRNADGGTWPAFGFVVGRSYTLRRRGSVLRVIGDVSQPDLAAARIERITGDAQMGSVMLEGIGGTGDAITGSVPSTLTTIGISAANIREILFTVLSVNTTTGPTINIDGQGALQIRDYRDGLLPVAALVPGPIYCAVKITGRWRLVTSEVDRAALTAALVTAGATQQAYTDAGDLRIMAEDRTVDLIGAPRATIEANPTAIAPSTLTVVLPGAVGLDGTAARFRAQISVGGLLRVGTFRVVGSDLQRVRYRDLTVTPGFNDLPLDLPVDAGDRIGWFLGDTRVRRVTGGGQGYYFNSSGQDVGLAPLSSMNTTDLMLAQVVMASGHSLTRRASVEGEARIDDIDRRLLSQEAGRRPLQSFGMTDRSRLDPPQAGASAPRHRVLDSVRPQGAIVRAECWSFAETTLRLTAYLQLSATSFRVRRFVTVPLVVGWNSIPLSLEVEDGEYIGFYTPVAAVPGDVVGVLPAETGTWSRNNDGDLTTESNMAYLATRQMYIRLTQAIGTPSSGGGGDFDFQAFTDLTAFEAAPNPSNGLYIYYG